MPGIGAPMLISGRIMSSARRERPIAMPIVTPAAAASAKPAIRRSSVSAAWRGRIPETVRRTSAAPITSSGGNSRGGKWPECAVISHRPPNTRKGKAVRATTHRRLSPAAADGAAAGTASVSGRAAIVLSHWLRQTKWRIRSSLPVRQAMSHPPIDNQAAKIALDEAPEAAGKDQAAPSRLADAVRAGAMLLATLAVGFAGGTVAKWLHFPLPYMTGALLITAALGLAGVPVRSLWQARAAGQFVTGSAIGTSFTPAIMATILVLLPAIVIGAAVSMVVGA